MKRTIAVAALTAATVVAAPLGAAAGAQEATPAGASVPQAVPGAARYEPLATAQRLLDTREGTTPVAGSVIDVAIDDELGATYAMVNLTAVDATGPGYLTSFAAGDDRPGTSNLNYVPGQIVANQAIVPIGDDGSISIYTHAATDFIVDLVGLYVPAEQSADGRIVDVAPTRVLDTRETSIVPAGGTVKAPVSEADLPLGTEAALITLTSVGSTGAGFLTAYSGDRPATSNLNTYGANQIVANQAIVPVADDGTITVYAGSASTNVVVDVIGYVTGDTADVAVGGLFVGAPEPVRVLDTRPSAWTAGSTNLVPTSLPEEAGSAALNVTAIGTAAPGYATVFAAGLPKPPTSNLNAFAAGQTVAAATTSAVNIGGFAALYTQMTANYAVDVFGFYVRAASPDAPAAPTVTTISNDSLLVDWDAPYDNGSPILGYRVTVQRVGGGTPLSVDVDDTTETTIDGLNPDTSYSVTVSAINDYGTSGPSPATQAATAASFLAPAEIVALPAAGDIDAPQAQLGSGVLGFSPVDEGSFVLQGYRVWVDDTEVDVCGETASGPCVDGAYPVPAVPDEDTVDAELLGLPDGEAVQVEVAGTGKVNDGAADYSVTGEMTAPVTIVAGPSLQSTPEQALPPATTDAGQALASPGTVLQFGGVEEGGALSDDTYLYDSETGLWALVDAGAPGTAPSPRQGAAMALIPEAEAVVLYGGTTESGPATDTWVWSLGGWVELTTASPVTTAPAAMVWDEANLQLLLIGSDGSVWFWDEDALDWAALVTTGDQPASVDQAVYDPSRQAVVTSTFVDPEEDGTGSVVLTAFDAETQAWTAFGESTTTSASAGYQLVWSDHLFGDAAGILPFSVTGLGILDAGGYQVEAQLDGLPGAFQDVTALLSPIDMPEAEWTPAAATYLPAPDQVAVTLTNGMTVLIGYAVL